MVESVYPTVEPVKQNGTLLLIMIENWMTWV